MKLPKIGARAGQTSQQRGDARRSKKARVKIAPQKRKLLVALILSGVSFLLLIGKLFDVSVIKGKTWTQKAMSQWTRVTSLKAERGQIQDRNGTVLASSYTTYQVCVNPQNIQESDRDRIAYILSTYLEMDYDTVYAKITKTKKKYPKSIYIKMSRNFTLMKN